MLYTATVGVKRLNGVTYPAFTRALFGDLPRCFFGDQRLRLRDDALPDVDGWWGKDGIQRL